MDSFDRFLVVLGEKWTLFNPERETQNRAHQFVRMYGLVLTTSPLVCWL